LCKATRGEISLGGSAGEKKNAFNARLGRGHGKEGTDKGRSHLGDGRVDLVL